MPSSEVNISASFVTVYFDQLMINNERYTIYRGEDNISDRNILVAFIKADRRVQNIVQERINSLTWLSHPNILEYVSAIELEHSGGGVVEENTREAIILQDFEGAATLDIFLRTQPSNSIKKEIIVQILKGLEYLHSNDIYHGNLDLQNILVKQTPSGPELKLAGFGLPEYLSEYPGLGLKPPEFFKTGEYTPVSDIWSFGALIYLIVMDTYPFGNPADVGIDVVRSNIIFGSRGKLDPELSSRINYIIHSCLLDEKNRICSIQRVHDILSGDIKVPDLFLKRVMILQEEKSEIATTQAVIPEIVEQEESVASVTGTSLSGAENRKRNDNWRDKSEGEQDTALGWTWSVLWIVVGLFTISFFSISIISKEKQITPASEKTIKKPDEEISLTEEKIVRSDPEEMNINRPIASPVIVENEDENKITETETVLPEDNSRIIFEAGSGLYGIRNGRGDIIVPARFEMIGDFGGEYELAMFKLNGKWGYLDKDGVQRIAPVYDFATDFVNAFAAVRKDGLWGYIDHLGNDRASIVYDYVKSYSEGLAAVSQDGKWGYINIERELVIPIQYDEVSSFKGGKAKVNWQERQQTINREGVCIQGCD